MVSPSNNLLRLTRSLFDDEAKRVEFLDALQNPREYPQSLIWTRARPESNPFALEERLGWQPEFVDRISSGQRPGADDLHASGFYYCLDTSSVFSASAMLALPAPPGRVLDMCSSPGGKGIFVWRAFKPELLICNEVIGKRIGALVSNLERCAVIPVYVSSQDSSRFVDSCRDCFDLVICDVPCSGQSLIARKMESPGCFHPATINLNSNRQKRIIANSATLVRPGGVLHYITCTYSRQENEAIIEWFLKRFSMFKPLTVSSLEACRSHLADFPAYRLWPQEGIGAGGFCCVLQKKGGDQEKSFNPDNLKIVWRAITPGLGR